MSSNKVKLDSEYITLAQALKVVGQAGSGGEAKAIVREGGISVNGVVEIQPGKKLRAGDRFSMVQGQKKLEWLVEA